MKLFVFHQLSALMRLASPAVTAAPVLITGHLGGVWLCGDEDVLLCREFQRITHLRKFKREEIKL
jgi:hypothetical protein